MTGSSNAGKTGTVEVSGFGDLNILDFIDAKMPAKGWPAKISIGGASKNGRLAGKLHYVDIDGTDADAVNACLERNTELPLTEIDCEIDIVRLFSEVERLDLVLPNTARLAQDHGMAVRG
ncbi:hypothetical protein NDN01_19795 [Sphingomonas sp. QA11]|uniref:hypothetical protein n=1 Tax=Sphingomonas sp. QA11 TaxID=2950605 RepID=UPI00234AC7C9|nr:hypothetical protein [Sphingomonas sp. QA11]WCM26227.1 hypothetical protein NDN01_19795 [Sphingomonas sp. QA11]